jgi:hypothetical protein
MATNDDHPLLHMTSKLDSRFSFNGDPEEEVKSDAIHKAVMRESWFQVSERSSRLLFET